MLEKPSLNKEIDLSQLRNPGNFIEGKIKERIFNKILKQMKIFNKSTNVKQQEGDIDLDEYKSKRNDKNVIK